MKPEYVINMWLLAQELGFNVLQNLCLAACSDRFNELPRSSIYELSRKKFLKLVLNNVRTNESFLHDVVKEWMNRNRVSILFLKIKLKN